MQFTAQFIITLLQSHPFVFWEKLPFYYLIRFLQINVMLLLFRMVPLFYRKDVSRF